MIIRVIYKANPGLVVFLQQLAHDFALVFCTDLLFAGFDRLLSSPSNNQVIHIHSKNNVFRLNLNETCKGTLLSL